MTMQPGSRLGPYEIVAPIGAGGMGEVYRARDTRLDRTVAVKVLPSALAGNAQLKLRFEREAKAISALAHPHICTLHDVGSHEGVDFLVMEHLDGETLADRLVKGPLPLDETLRYAIEIADALEKAHRRGIVHRDLKPGNIMLTRAGTKLLDFGLARTMDTEAPNPNSATVQVPTHRPLTEEGTIVGTFQYMAPEQLEGQAADARTDIFAFGAVLYEMLTGRRAFGGKSRASIIASILGAEPPPVSAIQPLTPPGLERVIAICLAKDPDERWQSAHDLKLELQGLTNAAAAVSLVSPRARKSKAGWIVAAAIALAAVGAFFAERRFNHQPPAPIRFEVMPSGETRFNSIDAPVRISPDGKRFVVRLETGNHAGILAVRDLDSTTLQPLAGTDGAFDPFWSPDGQQIGYFVQGKMKRINIASSAIATIASAGDSRGATWLPDDTILYAPSAVGTVLRVPAAGGTPKAVTKLDTARGETGHWRPSILPDGKHFLFIGACADAEKSGVYVGSIDSADVHRVLDVISETIYARPGHLLYLNGETLYAQPFSVSKVAPVGEPFAVASHVEWSDQYVSGAFSVSNNGVLVYQSRGTLPRNDLVRIDLADGKETPMELDGQNVDLSPDGTRLAFQRTDRQNRNQDIWTFDLRRKALARITFDSTQEIGPVWSPDLRRIAYSTYSAAGAFIRARTLAGNETDQTLLRNDFTAEPISWSPDGKTILAESSAPDMLLDLVTVDIATKKVTPFAATPFTEGSGRFSPDGKWIAYESNESGTREVYVQPFPADGQKFPISSGGGTAPRWSSDGRQLFYVAVNTLQSVEVRTAGGFEVSAPKTSIKVLTEDYVLSPDAKWVIVSRLESPTPQPVQVVVNWNTQPITR